MDTVLVSLPARVAKRLLSYSVNTEAFEDGSGDRQVLIESIEDAIACKPLGESDWVHLSRRAPINAGVAGPLRTSIVATAAE